MHIFIKQNFSGNFSSAPLKIFSRSRTGRGGMDGGNWGGLSENFGYHGWPMTNILKLHWLKCSKTVKKNRNLHQKINDLKSNISNSYVNFRLFGRKSQSQQILANNIIHFTRQFRSKNLTHFTNLNSLNITKNLPQQRSQKPYPLYKFSSEHVSGCCQKKNLHCTISIRPRTLFSKHLESKCQYIPVKV